MSLRQCCGLGLIVIGFLVTEPALSADEDWPCVQRRVAELSMGQMWAGPPVDAAASAWRDDPSLASLARTLASRRTTLDDASAAIERFSKDAGPDKEAKLTLLFAGVFELINTERRRLINGIERYARKQKTLADQISETSRILTHESKPAPERATLEHRLQWDTRIYDDRNQALQYVCESPVLLEQQVYALAQEISRHLE
ncbi:hypothetical protein MHY87_12910 [Microvirga sp. ACRRW]|uniref:hypothetical protein n=1 Tax=Microvirga sp. ACRRW TaxID=2918205 RepID=UPI001EF59311|nr:hypothetical protein [Microvirga sp. ACRRW]MCG7393808.1 hypothetical protein [Microvirga sp. ACRRW]